MILITASVELDAPHWEEATALAQQHCETSRREPGCVSHDWYPHPTRPHTLFFYEQWQDQAAIDAHFAEPASAEFVRSFAQWARSDVVLRILPVGDAIERRIAASSASNERSG